MKSFETAPETLLEKQNLHPLEYFWGGLIFCLFLMALPSSQTGMDFFSGLMSLTSLFWIFLHFRQWKWPKLGLERIWPAWLAIIAMGLTLNSRLAWPHWLKDFLEFRWILDFYVYVIFLHLYARRPQMPSFFLGVVCICSGYALLIYFLGYDLVRSTVPRDVNSASWRAGGFFANPMPLAQSYGPLLLLLVGLHQYAKNKILSYSAIVLTALTVVLTFTRGVWIAVVISLLVFAFNRSKKGGTLTLAGLLLCGGLAMMTSEKFRARIVNTVEMNNPWDMERITLWKANWEMIKDHPLVGVGYGQNVSVLREYYDKIGVPPEYFVGHAHNQYLQIFAGTGLLGFLCYLTFIFYILWQTWRGYRSHQDPDMKTLLLGGFTAQICFHIGSITEANFAISKNRYMFLFIAAVSLYLCLCKKSSDSGALNKN